MNHYFLFVKLLRLFLTVLLRLTCADELGSAWLLLIAVGLKCMILTVQFGLKFSERQEQYNVESF